MLRISILLAECMAFAFLSQYIKTRYDASGRWLSDLFAFCAALTLILFAGLRTGYNDTAAYMKSYASTPALGAFFQTADLSLGANPGFWFFASALKSLGVGPQGFVMVHAAVTVGIYFWFMRKYAPALPAVMFLFVVSGGYAFILAAMKQVMATALGLLAADRALRKKWVGYGFWIALALTMHPYIVMFLVIPFVIGSKPWRGSTFILLAIFAGLGLLFSSTALMMAWFSGLVGDEYSVETILGDGVNVFRFFVTLAPVVVSFVFRKQLYEDCPKAIRLMFFFCLIGAELMFLALFGNAVLVGRLPFYFGVGGYITIAWAMHRLRGQRMGKAFNATVVICYLVYFVYANSGSRSFEADYSSITLWQFITGG